ncbi:MAG: hypothetical protein ACUVQY_09910 [Thermoproteota archaeon]
MSRNEGDGEGALFQRIVLLFSISLILLFIVYELLEAPSKDFILIKTVNFKEEYHEAFITLVLKNNSSKRHEGFLVTLLGYEDSVVAENITHYRFDDFKTLDFNILMLNPGEEKELTLTIKIDTEVKRIIMLYSYDSNLAFYTGYAPIAIRKERTVWVQNWLG